MKLLEIIPLRQYISLTRKGGDIYRILTVNISIKLKYR